MNDQIINQKLNEALKLFDDGNSYNEIRKYFGDSLDEESISYIIRLVDEFAIEESLIQEDIKKAKFKISLGIVATIVSLILLYSFYINEALHGVTGILAYLSMAFSIYLMWMGYKEKKRLSKTTPEIDDSKFKMKRRKKN